MHKKGHLWQRSARAQVRSLFPLLLQKAPESRRKRKSAQKCREKNRAGVGRKQRRNRYTAHTTTCPRTTGTGARAEQENGSQANACRENHQARGTNRTHRERYGEAGENGRDSNARQRARKGEGSRVGRELSKGSHTFDASDIVGVGAGEEAVGPLLFVEPDENPAVDQLVAERLVLLRRAIAPVHLRMIVRGERTNTRAFAKRKEKAAKKKRERRRHLSRYKLTGSRNASAQKNPKEAT